MISLGISIDLESIMNGVKTLLLLKTLYAVNCCIKSILFFSEDFRLIIHHWQMDHYHKMDFPTTLFAKLAKQSIIMQSSVFKQILRSQTVNNLSVKVTATVLLN